jgi:hypothetical protein
MNQDNVKEKVQQIASTMKLMCGIGNNAAWLVCLEAHDHIKRSRLYKKRIKGGNTVGWEFKKVINLYHKYEQQLLYAYNYRLFNVGDMSPSLRKKFGNITNRDYYDMWSATGATAYTKVKPFITSLWNKYRLILSNHGNTEPDIVAWAFTAQALINMAIRIYNTAIEECVTDTGIQRTILERCFSQLSFGNIGKAWDRATQALAPLTANYTLSSTEQKNVDLGLNQLFDSLTDPHLIFNATKANVEDYSEIFRTKGEMKKTLDEIAKVEEITINELNNS